MSLTAPDVIGVEVLAAAGTLPALAADVAASHAAVHTRRAYAGAYRSFCAFLVTRHGEPSLEAFTPGALTAYRDALVSAGAAPSTVASRLSALRVLGARLGLDPQLQHVRGQAADPLPSPALTRAELETLLAIPDRRSIRGKRDLALMLLLAEAGLRRSEAATLTIDDITERRRAPNSTAIATRSKRTGFQVHVHHAKRGRHRTVPLTARTVKALHAWYHARPLIDGDWLLLTLPTNPNPPGPLSGRTFGRIITSNARRARLPERHQSAHTLRHTFCTLLADAGVGLEVIAELAGHADIRTTRRYLQVRQHRLEEGTERLAAGRPSHTPNLSRGLKTSTRRSSS